MWQERSELRSFEFQVGSWLRGGQGSRPGHSTFPGLPGSPSSWRNPLGLITGIAKQGFFFSCRCPLSLRLSQPGREARASNDAWRERWFPLLSLWDWRSPLSGLISLIQTPAGWPLGQALPSLAFLARPPASRAGEGLLINSLPSKSDAKALPSAGLCKSSYQISKIQLDLQVSSEI